MSRYLPIALLVVALVACAALRAAAVFSKPVFFHDESHTYQAATAHVGEAAQITYGRLPPYGQWVSAAEWKRLLRPSRPWDMATIGRDALAYDVHPPLYYWLLHAACVVFGTHLWTGTLLNSILDLFTLFAVYRFARYAIGDRLAAAAAAFIWATTAAALQVAVVEARMYSLLTLLAVLFVHQAARFFHDSGRPRWVRLPVMAALTTAGALTHHHFGLLIAGTFGWILITRAKQPGKRNRLLAGIGAVAAGYILLVAVHPVFFGTGYKHLSDTRLPDAAGLANRANQALDALAQFLIERRFEGIVPRGVIIALACVAPALLLVAALRLWRLRRRNALAKASVSSSLHDIEGLTKREDGRSPAGGFAIAVGTWLMVVTISLYLAGVTPAHAMSSRYLALIWPFVAVAAGVLLARRQGAGDADAVSPARMTGVLTTCVLAVAAGAIAAHLQWRDLDWHPGAPRADALVRSADRVIIDNIGRGHWPRPVWRLKEDAQVLIALPNDLLRRPAAWRRELTPGTVYISPARSAAQVREKLVQSFDRDHVVETVGHLYGIGDVYLLGERRAPVSTTKPAAAKTAAPTTRPAMTTPSIATQPATAPGN